MTPFKKIAEIPAWKKFIAIVIISGISGVTALYIPILIDRELYQNLVLTKLKESVDYKIEAGPSALFIFPFPELRLSEITIYNSRKVDPVSIAKLGEVKIRFSWMSFFFRKIQISDIEIRNGNLSIERNIKGVWNFSTEENKKNTENYLLKLISIKSLTLENFNIHFEDQIEKETRDLYIYKSNLKLSGYVQSIKIYFLGKLENERMEINSSLQFSNKKWDYSSLVGNARIDLDNFNISIFKNYLKIFHNANFHNSKIKGTFLISKKDPEILNIKLKEISLLNFGLTGQNYFSPLRLSSDIDYNHKENKYIFHSIVGDENGVFRGKANGVMKLGLNGELYLTISSDYSDFDSVMKLIKVFSFRLSGKNPNATFIANYNLSLTNVKIWGFQLNKCEMDLKSINKTYFVKRLEASLFNGEIVGQGEMSFDHIPTYDFEIVFSSLDSEKFIGHYTKDKYVTGQLEGIIKLSLVGKSVQDLFRTLRATGNLTIYRGELLGYANIVKPIASIGKFINVLGPKGKSTEFQYLHAEYSINDEEIDFKKIKMKGVGIDIDGKGVIGFNKEIDMRFTAGLGGIVGKALKVPVFYKGVMPKNWAFVDPIWLATVAGGVILSAPGSLFGGPVGGGIAGSAAYEYVRGFWDGMTGIFKKDKQKEKK